jgi:hypothetical protein
MTSNEYGTCKFSDTGKNYRLQEGNGPGTYRRSHGIGHIIGTYIPGHIKSQKGDNNKY